MGDWVNDACSFKLFFSNWNYRQVIICNDWWSIVLPTTTIEINLCNIISSPNNNKGVPRRFGARSVCRTIKLPPAWCVLITLCIRLEVLLTISARKGCFIRSIVQCICTRPVAVDFVRTIILDPVQRGHRHVARYRRLILGWMFFITPN
jgi:hypothetical protein